MRKACFGLASEIEKENLLALKQLICGEVHFTPPQLFERFDGELGRLVKRRADAWRDERLFEVQTERFSAQVVPLEVA